MSLPALVFVLAMGGVPVAPHAAPFDYPRAATAEDELFVRATTRSCEVRGLSDAERAAVQTAVGRLEAALLDDAVVTALREHSVDADRLVSRLAEPGRPAVHLLSFGGEGCPGPLAAGRANAVTTADGRLVLLSRAYLARTVDDAALAGTLAHETAHVLGYEHPQGGAAYAASVPVFFGCVVAHHRAGEELRAACAPPSSSSWHVARSSR